MTGGDGADRPGAVCRSCGSDPLTEVIDLGEHPEANSFPGREDDLDAELRWPLRLFVCERCWLVQLDDAGPPEFALPGPPPYELSETMRTHAEEFVDDVMRRLPASDSPSVIELASHGAYLHPFLATRGIQSLIVEGSPAMAAAASERGYPVSRHEFGRLTAEQLASESGRADLILDNYLLAHVDDPDDLAAGIQGLLKPGGMAVVELAHVLGLVADEAFDSIRHGHFSYFGFLSLTHLLERHALVAFDVAPQPVYGGSLRVFIAHAGDTTHPIAPAVGEMLAVEAHAGLAAISTYRRFAAGVGDRRAALRAFLAARRASGEVVVGYGAPSRASTLLNYCGITTELLPWTVDRSPAKQGRVVPGCGILIEAPEAILRAKPPFVLVLTWDIRDEVRRQMHEVGAWGGQFVVPLPRLEILPPAGREGEPRGFSAPGEAADDSR